MRETVLLALLVAGATALAGCTGGGDSTASGDGGGDGTLAEGKGALEATVVDETITPLSGARLTLRDTPHQAFTDEGGRARFTDIDPGRYQVIAEALGYQTVARAVDIAPGEVAATSFTLEELPVEELGTPYRDEAVREGFLACGFGTVALIGAPCGDVDPNDEFLFEFNVTTGLRTLQAELVWVPTGGITSQELWFAIERDGCGVTCDETWGEAQGRSPLKIRLDQDSPRLNLTEEKALQVRVFPAATMTPAAYYQQRFTLYLTEFYHEPANPAFSAVPDE